jgi:hypothetical protein
MSANAAAAANRVFRIVLNPYVLSPFAHFALDATHAQRLSRLIVPRYIFAVSTNKSGDSSVLVGPLFTRSIENSPAISVGAGHRRVNP